MQRKLYTVNLISDRELSIRFELDESEQEFVKRSTCNDRGHLVMATLLKTRKQLGYFPVLENVPGQFDMPPKLWPLDEDHYRTTLHRHRLTCRNYLGSIAFSDEHKKLIVDSVHNAVYTMSDPADLINVAIEVLSDAKVELPAFSTLDRLVNHERQKIHTELYLKITDTLESDQCQLLDELLEVEEGERITAFARMKQTPVSEKNERRASFSTEKNTGPAR